MNDLFIEAEAKPEPETMPAKIERPRYEAGWYRDLSNDDYHGSAGTSSSRIKTLIDKTPAHFKHGLETQDNATTAAMELGTAFHTLTLEPDEFENSVFVLPELNLQTKADKEIKAKILDEHAGKAIITKEQLAKAKAMADAVRSHPIASVLLDDIIAESSVYWWYRNGDTSDDTHYKEMLKVRPDALGPTHGVIIDLKSSIDPTYSGFQKAIQNHYYHVSAAMYLEGVNQCQELLKATRCIAYTKFIWIVCESTEPYTVAVYEASPEYIAIGRELYRRALYKLQKARDNNFQAFPDDIRIIEPPTWAKRFPIV